MIRRPYEAVAATVNWFAEEMKHKLHKNSHKTDWNDIKLEKLMDRLREEVTELRREVARYPHPWEHLTNNPADRVISECADVANFAMMIADNVRVK